MSWAPPTPDERERLIARYVREEGEPGFFRASCGSYVVRSDVGRGFALDVALFLERFRQQFLAIFRDPPHERYPPLVVVFKDEARYRRLFPGSSRGQYRSDARTLFTYLDRAKGERDFATFYFRILLHEGSHQLLHAITGNPRLPPWFDEGIAGYFQEWDVRCPLAENLERLRHESYRLAEIEAAYGSERWVPLRRLFALSNEDWTPDDYGPRTYLHYAEAAAFISFLVATKPGQRFFVRVYRCVREGGRLEDALAAEDLRRLEAGWKEDLERRLAEAEAKRRGREGPAPPR